MAQRTQEALPDAAFQGHSFSLALGNGEVVSGPGIWAMRFDTTDEDLRDEQGVERRWRTEAALVSLDGQSYLALRLSVVTATPGLSFFRSAPTLIRELSVSPGIFFDGFRPLIHKSGAREEITAKQLLAFLLKQDRRPVLAISEYDSGETAIDVEGLAKATAGFAHVVRVPPALSRELSRILGWKWSVFGGAVRLYMPGLDVERQNSRAHPLWGAGIIGTDIADQRRWQRRVVDRVLAASVARSDLDDLAPGFVAINAYLKALQQKEASKAAREAEKLVEQAKNSDEELGALKAELSAVRVERDSVRAELGAVTAKFDEISQERDLAYEVNEEHSEEIERLRAQVFLVNAKSRQLEDRLKRTGGQTEEVPTPSSYDELQDWAGHYFPDRMIILSKAMRTAKKAAYADPVRVFTCLKLLANEYVDMRRGIDGAVALYNDACANLRVEISGVGSALEDRRYREQFTVPYKSAYAEMDLHLSPAPGTAERGSVDPKKTFRIYFFWDAEDEVVVVGSLPGHLTTGMTN